MGRRPCSRPPDTPQDTWDSVRAPLAQGWEAANVCRCEFCACDGDAEANQTSPLPREGTEPPSSGLREAEGSGAVAGGVGRKDPLARGTGGPWRGARGRPQAGRGRAHSRQRMHSLRACVLPRTRRTAVTGSGNRTCTGTPKRYQLCRVQVRPRLAGDWAWPCLTPGRSRGVTSVAPGLSDTLPWACPQRPMEEEGGEGPWAQRALPASDQICDTRWVLPARVGMRTHFCGWSLTLGLGVSVPG